MKKYRIHFVVHDPMAPPKYEDIETDLYPTFVSKSPFLRFGDECMINMSYVTYVELLMEED